MKIFTFESQNSEETVRFGELLAKYLKRGDIIALFGDLGSGKTTLVKGIAKGSNVKTEDVNSPTFVLMNLYHGKLPIYHFDLYRLEDTKEIDRLGCQEFFYDNGVSIIEWADRIPEVSKRADVVIKMTRKDTNKREIRVILRQSRRISDSSLRSK